MSVAGGEACLWTEGGREWGRGGGEGQRGGAAGGEVGRGRDGGCAHFIRSRSRMTIDPRIRIVLGRSTPAFRRPGRYSVHQARRPGGGEETAV